MINRILGAVALLMAVSPVWAVEVASIVSCRADGEVWLCAAWRDGKVEVFRSERYLSEVVFRDAPEQTPPSPGMDAVPTLAGPELGEAIAPRFTLQLYACRTQNCLDKVGAAAKIPGSRKVYIKNDDTLWQVLVAGEYTSVKTATEAAATLMARYQLRDKPWVRSLESIRRRQVKY